MRRLAAKMGERLTRTIGEEIQPVTWANPSRFLSCPMPGRRVPDFRIRSILRYLRLLLLPVWAARYLP